MHLLQILRFTLPSGPGFWTPLLFVLLFYLVRRYATPAPRHPPGPQKDPFIGHLRHIPTVGQPKAFSDLAKRYGDVIFFSVLGKKILVLDTIEAARDLLERKSKIYSDRPRFVLLAELMGWGKVLTHMEYGPHFRRQRKFIQGSFHQRAVRGFFPILDTCSKVLLRGFDRAPDCYAQYIRRFAASTIMQITYGHTVASDNDPYVRLSERATKATVESSCGMGSSIIDLIPPMKHLPGWMLPSKRNALKIKVDVEHMLRSPFEMVKSQMNAGKAPPSFTRALLEAHALENGNIVNSENEEDILAAAGVLYGAAADTTTCFLLGFILAMTRHPEIYAKAQTEMDRVVGPERLPTFGDRDSLPYLACIQKEVYRWNCPVPLGIPHRLMQDDVYRSWIIPEDTIVIANIWSMTQQCDKPDEFIPERYLNADTGAPDPSVTFGFGRRICPGKHLADASVWLVMARIIATMDIKLPLDDNGKEYIPEAKFSDSFVRHPVEFNCRFSPRGSRKELYSDV